MPKPDTYKLINRLPVPCFDLLEWARWFETADRIVAKTEVGCLRVSTIFIGLDHSFDDGPPLLFETMIFGDIEDHYQERCSTWDEAERQHAEAVEIAQEKVREADALLMPAAAGDKP